MPAVDNRLSMLTSRLAPASVLVILASGLSLAACGGSQAQVEQPATTATESERAEATAAPAPEPEEVVPDVVARATLTPLVSSIVPGKTFQMALKFEIVDGYRLSWTNPGDVGKMPTVRFSAPDGFEVGPLDWPAPERFRVTEELSSYGYEDEAAVFTTIRVPRNIKTNEAYRFNVDAEWVACKKQCSKENVSAFIELVAGWRGGQRIEDEVLDRLMARIPKPFSDLEGAEQKWASRGRRPVLVLRAPSVRFVDFYPASPDIAVESLSIKRDGSEVSMSFEEVPAGAVRGVVRIDRRGKSDFFSIEAAPAEDT